MYENSSFKKKIVKEPANRGEYMYEMSDVIPAEVTINEVT